ncbi:MAG: DUF5665 domain-containing protein [Rhodobacterales bacterium]|jgi:hypothetical protein|nr:DUF5665 domain-containing protein [Pseudomonadota bacterium]MDA1286039.1 DUF5665 domain-containing protein [Pseudomonadota bacterium]
MAQAEQPDDENDLKNQLASLAQGLERLNNQTFLKRQNSPVRLLAFRFLGGLAFGLGSFLGATLVVSLLVFSLAQINFIPIIGEWAAQIAERIQQ